MSRFRTAVAVAAALMSAACYRVTVVTSPAGSAATPTVNKEWNNSFVYGLVPPQPLNVSSECPGGNVTKVVTERSFLNGLVGAITWGIYTPIKIQVACTGGRSSSLGLPAELLGTPAAEVAPAAPADTAATR